MIGPKGSDRRKVLAAGAVVFGAVGGLVAFIFAIFALINLNMALVGGPWTGLFDSTSATGRGATGGQIALTLLLVAVEFFIVAYVVAAINDRRK